MDGIGDEAYLGYQPRTGGSVTVRVGNVILFVTYNGSVHRTNPKTSLIPAQTAMDGAKYAVTEAARKLTG
ncbi:hypothetical protein [Actinomadura xylanilytica]|uniref:hypothetical protein n=1 Tax=Actinomadura xylanilytica TaxID=887459 RepID=UPI00255B3371|nr:hypothetical protein [Actinomadura xylanilytica]MDL4773987.1 hypothetical protein [Actinomadura xylanilytica]